MPRKKKTFLLILFGVVFFLSVYLIRIRGDMADFQVNYQAGQRLRAGETLYRTDDGHFMFKYLPFSAILYVPLTYLPIEAAKATWYALLVVCTVLLFYASNKILPQRPDASLYLVVLPPLILAKFFLREMKLGQINTIVTLILLFMIGFLVSETRARTPGAEAKAGALTNRSWPGRF